VDIRTLIKKDCLCILEDSKKSEVLISMMEQAVEQSSENIDLEVLKREIFYREELMSTGIGLGLGVPHVRLEGLKEPVICLGVQKKGIYDYESIDQQPVKVVLMILVGKDQHRQYIRILAQLTGLIKNRNLIPELIEAQSTEDIYQIMVEA